MSKDFNKQKILTESRELYRDYVDNLASRSYSMQDFTISMQTKYSYLNTNFQSIFNMSISNKYDYNRLSIMVNMAEKVKNDEISEHDASVKVGQVLVDEIVKPQLDKSS